MPAEPDADALRLRSAALAEQAADVREAVTNTLAEREVALTVGRQRAERAMEALEHQLDGAGELMIQSIGAAEESAARADHLGELVDKALLEGNEQLARDLSNESALARQQATSYSAQADAAEQDFVRLKDEIVEQRARTTEIDIEAVQLHSQQAESFLALDDLDARAAVYAEAAERQQQFEAMNAEPLPDDDSANRILLERWEVQAQAGQLMEAADAMVVNPAALLDVAPGLDLDPAVALAAPTPEPSVAEPAPEVVDEPGPAAAQAPAGEHTLGEAFGTQAQSDDVDFYDKWFADDPEPAPEPAVVPEPIVVPEPTVLEVVAEKVDDALRSLLPGPVEEEVLLFDGVRDAMEQAGVPFSSEPDPPAVEPDDGTEWFSIDE